jgi:NAD(P)-dependent dehydrogenase (short-subunit alcohol dehydrogenase family)
VTSDLKEFDLTGRVVIITGGAGLLGERHGHAIARAGGIPVFLDVRADEARRKAEIVRAKFGASAEGVGVDITNPESVSAAKERVLELFGKVNVLINNAASNPPPELFGGESSRLEQFSLERWNSDLAVGLTGAFLCSQIFGCEMARQGQGVIVNIASDYALIAPDQRIYHQPGVPAERQPVKPVTYSVVKAGILGLTRYLATYWADRGIRVNALCPGSVFSGQGTDFVSNVSALIPMGRMANAWDYEGAILFLCSDASAYMTGAHLVVDGGRTAW